MTIIEVLNKFSDEFPQAKVDDYRPLADLFIRDKVGIVVWLKNGDMIVYCPKEIQKDT